MREPKAGDKVKALGDSDGFFKHGCEGVLTNQMPLGQWWAVFTPSEDVLSFPAGADIAGVHREATEWCIGSYPDGFEFIDD